MASDAAGMSTGAKVALIVVSILAAVGIGFGIFLFIQNRKLKKEIAALKASGGSTAPSTTSTTQSAGTISTSSGTMEVPAGTQVITTSTGRKYVPLN